MLSLLFFFFQAEDGIRDGHVTGVQTCALPISFCHRGGHANWKGSRRTRERAAPGLVRRRARSEERRVGKECRARWGADELKRDGEGEGGGEGGEQQQLGGRDAGMGHGGALEMR